MDYRSRTSPARSDAKFDTSTPMGSTIAKVLFIVSCLSILLALSVMGGIGTLGLAAFKTIILNRILHIELSLFDSLRDVAARVANALGMPFLFTLMKVFLDFLEYLNFIQIDFGLVGVTCQGLVAAVELLTMLRLLDLSSFTSNLKVNIPKSCFSLVVTIALATNLVDIYPPA